MQYSHLFQENKALTKPLRLDDLPLPRRVWWPWDQPADKVAFERHFRVGGEAQGNLFLSASGTVCAWLDDVPISVPGDPLPSWRSMRRIPVELRDGEHRLCVVANPGPQGQPYFLACLDWRQAGNRQRVATDAGWIMTANPLPGWQEGDDRQGWRAAWAFDGPWSEPWGMPCNAPQDFCRLSSGWQEVIIEPLQRIAALYNGQAAVGAAARLYPDGALEFHPPLPYAAQPPHIEEKRPGLEWYRNREAHSLILNTWLDLFEGRAAHIVLDAGEETFARLVVRLRNGGPAVLAITTGESLPEVQRYARRVTDIFTLRDGESFTTAPTGFRYIKVMALSAGSREASVILEPVIAEHIRYPVEDRGTFRCSDPVLNEIWDLSRRTVHLCMQNEVWDGIKRDQLPWMGDLYTEALAIYHLFGDGRLARRTLEILAEVGPAPARPLERQAAPGLAEIWRSAGGSHPGAGSGDINGIPSYTLWWILGLADYVYYTCDRSLIEEVAQELRATLDHVAGWVGEDGIWRFHGGWDFVDWAPVTAVERETFCHLLAIRALKEGAKMLEGIGQTAGDLWETSFRMVRAARDAWVREKEYTFGGSHHVNSMAIRSGILTSEEICDLFARTLQNDPPISMTYWHRALDLEAALLAGQAQWGLDYIRRHWGTAVRMGLTTLWEAFDPAWMGADPHGVSIVGAEYARYGGYETSLCHGWSSGPAVWLHKAILGVQPEEAGFTAVRFEPHLGDLDWAEGSLPTPHGEIRVKLCRGTGDMPSKPQARIEAPDGIVIRIAENVAKEWSIER
jgi:hypothetical protein